MTVYLGRPITRRRTTTNRRAAQFNCYTNNYSLLLFRNRAGEETLLLLLLPYKLQEIFPRGKTSRLQLFMKTASPQQYFYSRRNWLGGSWANLVLDSKWTSFLSFLLWKNLSSLILVTWHSIRSQSFVGIRSNPKKKDTRKQIFFVFQHHLLRLFILFVQSFSLYNVISINLHEKNEEEAVVMHTTVIHNCLFVLFWNKKNL